MIRANDRGLSNPPPVVDEPASPGLLNVRNIVILVGIIAWLAVLLLFVVPQLTRKSTPAASTPPSAAAAAEAQPATAASTAQLAAGVAPKAVPSPHLDVTGRVFNLAGGAGSFKYLKLSVEIQFVDEKGAFAKAKGDALSKLEAGFVADHPGTLAAFNDILTTSVSSKTAGDLATPAGKEALRQELITKFNAALAGSQERVSYIIFNDFVMQ